MRGAHARAYGSRLSPAGPPAPVPGTPLGTSGASGGSGFFFFGIAALLATIGLLGAALLATVRIPIAVPPPQPFLLLPERPG